MIWRPQTWFVLPVTLITALVSLFSREEYRHSVVWSVDAALTALYLLWPLTIGAGAMATIRIRRGVSSELIDALPRGAAIRFWLHQSAKVGLWSAAGLVLASVTAIAIAASTGSTVTVQALSPLLPAIAAVLAAGLVGGALGMVAPYWLLPPVATITVFALFMLVPGAMQIITFVGLTTPDITALHLPLGAIALLCSIFAGLALGGGLLAAGIGAGHPRAGVLGSGICVLLSATLATSGNLFAPRVWSDDSTWPCTDVDATDAVLCLSPDQQHRLEEAASVATPLVEPIEALTPSPGPIRLTTTGAVNDDSPATSVRISLPIGPEPLTLAAMAEPITSSLSRCGPRNTPPRPEVIDANAAAHLTLYVWLTGIEQDPDLLEHFGLSEDPPDRSEAISALEWLQRCE